MTPSTTKSVLVSACLVGRACRFDGGDCLRGTLVEQLAADGLQLVPFCPEESGGLGTPRPAASIQAGGAEGVLDGEAEVRTLDGDDVTAAFRSGANQALQTCGEESIHQAYLKEGSPSCGVRRTHVDGEKAAGPGVTSALLARNGIEVIGVE